jgi:hypothetical protein
MKIRKILPLLALAVIALFTLSSCDQILESMFPADTGQLVTQGKNSISVELGVNWLTYPGTGKLIVEIKDSSNKLIETRQFDVYYTGYDTIYYSAEFNFLFDGTYLIYAWIDKNGNGIADDPNYGDLFPASVTVDSANMNGYQYIYVY